MSVHEVVRLTKSDTSALGAAPMPLGDVLRQTPPAVRHAISMAVTGNSALAGRPPNWLVAASDVRVVDIEINGDAVLHFHAPTLGEAAPELYRQQELWTTRPDPESTGFGLFRDMLRDVRAGQEDSDRFDQRLLQRVAHFGAALRELESIVVGNDAPDTPRAILDSVTVDAARLLSSETPRPRAVRVVGALDMIRASSRTFALRLDDGQEVRGVFAEGATDAVAGLFRRRVLVLGRAVYRPSGRLLRLDAEEISAGEGEPSLWSRIPEPLDRSTSASFTGSQRGKRGVAAFFGTWPGDETDQELLAALKALD